MSVEATPTDRAPLDIHQHGDHAEPEPLTEFANRAREFSNVYAVDVWNHRSGSSEVVLQARNFDGVVKAAVDNNDALQLNYVVPLSEDRVEFSVYPADN